MIAANRRNAVLAGFCTGDAAVAAPLTVFSLLSPAVPLSSQFRPGWKKRLTDIPDDVVKQGREKPSRRMRKSARRRCRRALFSRDHSVLGLYSETAAC